MTNDPARPGFQPVQSLPEEPPRRRWLLAVAAVLIVGAVGVAVAMLALGGPGPGGASPSPTLVAGEPTTPAEPSPTPIATPTGSPGRSPSGSPSATVPGSPTGEPGESPAESPAGSPGDGPSGSVPPDIAALIDAVVEQVPPIRELEPQREVPYEMVTREQFQANLQELFEEEVDPELLATEERLLKRLGLLPDELDLHSLLLELYGAGVAAYYEPETSTFFVIEREGRFGPLDRMYVAHEYTHALQDQHYDLAGTRITDPSQGDAALAQLAAVEGDASWLMVLWAQEHLTFQEVFELLQESLAPADQELLDDMPPILTRQLVFPYNEGMIFSSMLHQEGGWEAINETIVEPPLSTEQIIHPEKYAAGEEPVEVEIRDVADDLGEGWTRSYEQTFGELNVHVFAAGDEAPPETAPGTMPEYPFAEVAAGWGGDRLHMYEGPDDGWAIVWETAWDTAADAEEFADRAEELQPTLDGVSALDASTDVVTLLVASDEATLERLQDALEG